MANSGMSRAIVVISDRLDGVGTADVNLDREQAARQWKLGLRGPAPALVAAQDQRSDVRVAGGYLERLPLAAIRAGHVDFAEIWHHALGDNLPACQYDSAFLARRVFQASSGHAPFHSKDILGFIDAFGPPKILCIWGLGVSDAILSACRTSIILYNSIDVPPLRMPASSVGHFDVVLTGSQWQSDAVRNLDPDLPSPILPIGPEFASPETFFPIETEKRFDLVYVAAAQDYKRHDILFDALQRAPRRLRALCVFGYGEKADGLRQKAAEMGLDVEFVGPPGVTHPEVNRLINQARIGVVCGIEDGAPAILTEYMLAGLPVVANADLKCGLQYITPQTGVAAPADRFENAVLDVLDRVDAFSPREAVLENWIWPLSIERLGGLLAQKRPRPMPPVPERSSARLHLQHAE